ncbi:MAG TPA: hypothetical protein VFE53_05920 [Mucilaginibacter sp.]|jgi:hypothetical protein|nr:hypothetical protein [Mucilaginibacter sp.]
MQDKIALFDHLVAAFPAAVRKGDTIPYTSLNGHMYSYFSKDGFLALRLPAEAREEFLKKYNTTLVAAYGIVQKEYVTVPDNLLEKTTDLIPWFEKSYNYVSGLKPKVAKSKK